MELKDHALKMLLNFVFTRFKSISFQSRIYWYKYILRKKFRLSFSGLIKITSSDGRNLLVASKRVRHKYQLPGGVFFCFNSWADPSLLEQDEVMNDIPKLDMRFKVKDGKEARIPEIINKFMSGACRELTPEREFHEELIETNILDKELFSSPKFYKTHTHEIDFEMTKGRGGEFCSFYRFDIFEMILNEKQQDFIDKIAKEARTTSQYVFATKNELVRGLPDESGCEIQFPDFVKSIL